MAVLDQQERTGWVGWLIFAAVIMAILGVFHAMAGLVALFNDDYYVVTEGGLVIDVDYAAWGWAHLVLGVVLGFAAFSLASGRMFGRVVGVIVASVSAIVNIAFLAASPVWSVTMIALAIIVIYAAVVHGRELEA